MCGRTTKLLLLLCVLSIAGVLFAWASSYGTSLVTAHDGRLLVLVAPDIDGHRHLRRAAKYQDPHETVVEVLASSKPDWRQLGVDYRSYDQPTDFNAAKGAYDTVVLKIVSIPLWALALLPLVPTVLLVAYLRRSRRRAQAGTCLHCGYDLRGITSDRCPECGRLVPDSSTAEPTARPDRPIPQPRLQ